MEVKLITLPPNVQITMTEQEAKIASAQLNAARANLPQTDESLSVLTDLTSKINAAVGP